MVPPGEPGLLACDGADDLAALEELDEARLLQNLSGRFLQQRVYTYIGDILIAMNPFQSLPLYEKPVSEKYQNHDKGILPPHIFAIADRAYQAMLGHLATGPQNQCIVISGESGAGKTESVKLLLQHIMHLCKGNSQLEQQILQKEAQKLFEGKEHLCIGDHLSLLSGCADARDSIAKVAYGRVFGWIVRKINELLAENVDPEVKLREIGILDIFGFENFVVNRFEQLCINLANEQLQHFFNYHIFQLEQAAYQEEGLPWEAITFNNNKPILATDKTFVDKLNSTFKGNSHFQPCRGHVLGFSIIHYAGKVQYASSGLLEKNRDTLPANIRGLFINSVTPLLSVLFTGNDHLSPKIWHDLFFVKTACSQMLLSKYRILLIKPDVPLTRESCLEILRSAELKGWRCGKSRLFFKYWHQELLTKSMDRLEKAAIIIQKTYKRFCCRKSYQKLVVELRAREKHLQEEAERERNRQLELESQAQIASPVPVPRRRRPQPFPRSQHGADSLTQPPVPRPRSKLTESTPFDNFLHSSPCPVLGTEGQTGEEEEMRQIKRGATLRWFRETQAWKVMQDDGAFPGWLHGMISRREAENLLMDKPLGCFLVRISQSRPGYTLSYR
ncbi:butyrophilin-like protein 2 [Platysternon megacephalum]|uniref:non-specific serine/threonine protein kinase n=1 Tax=Platysternon megacephalum TaxID=55544 RepID=A0A4D9DLR6_9SAUR|nr:butyrophilin-like protein 2 [Platysternon megacephalum]